MLCLACGESEDETRGTDEGKLPDGAERHVVGRCLIFVFAVRHYKTIIRDCAMEGLPVDMTDAVQFRRSASAELPSR